MSKKQKKDKTACSTRQLMGIEEIMDILLGVVAGINDLADVIKMIIIFLIQQLDKFFIIVQDIASLGRIPVDVAVIGVFIHLRIIGFCRCFGVFFYRTTWHDKEVFYIFPVQPDGEDRLAVIDAVIDVSIDVDDILNRTDIGFFDDDIIFFQLTQTFCWNIFRKTA